MKNAGYGAKRRFPEWSLYSTAGTRKYININERQRFLSAARRQDAKTRVLCLVLCYTGCRLSEALALTADAVQPETNIIALCTLKRRKRHAVIREVPVPASLIGELLALAAENGASQHSGLLWSWGRTWAWMQIKAVMAEADIHGLYATAKGLRHGFGIHAVHSGVPLSLVQKWMGHARLSTTAIYTNPVGPDEYAFAGKMWQPTDYASMVS